MAWVTLGDALEAALVSMIDDGDLGGVDAPSDASTSKKPADAETPAVVRVQRQGEEKPGESSRGRVNAALLTSRHRHTGAIGPKVAKGSPARPVCLCLVVDNGLGGGRRQEEGTSAADPRNNQGGGRVRELKLRVV